MLTIPLPPELNKNELKSNNHNSLHVSKYNSRTVPEYRDFLYPIATYQWQFLPYNAWNQLLHELQACSTYIVAS